MARVLERSPGAGGKDAEGVKGLERKTLELEETMEGTEQAMETELSLSFVRSLLSLCL